MLWWECDCGAVIHFAVRWEAGSFVQLKLCPPSFHPVGIRYNVFLALPLYLYSYIPIIEIDVGAVTGYVMGVLLPNFPIFNGG